MDLASECSVSKSPSVHEEDDTDATSVANFDATIINGDVVKEVGNSGSVESKGSHSDMNNVVPDVGVGQPLNSPPISGKAKGRGLKKWKRIKRNIGSGGDSRASVDDSPSIVDDYSRPVKRGLSNAASLTKPSHHFSVGDKEKGEGEGSVGSANIAENGEYFRQGSSSDSRLAVGAVFAAGNDSENSEDRSSKSSTAASVPKARHQKVLEKNNVSGKGLGSSLQRSSQKGKSWVETTKKAKGERVKTEKENSHSSMESDSRSSNFVFMQEGFSASSNGNGKQSVKVTNYDGENSDEAQASEQHFNEDLQAGSNIESLDNDLSEDDLATGSSSWKAKQDSSNNRIPSADSDPLVKSVFTLQSVQEALEKELHEFEEIGKENGFTSIEGEIEIDQTHFENIEQSGSTSSLESEVITLTVKVNTLEEKLEEAKAMLKVKEARVLDLEATVHLAKSVNGESSEETDIKELETEVESIFKQKIEAEVEYMAIASKIKKLKNVSTDQTALVEEQKHLVEEQMHLVDEQKQMLNKLDEAETKAKTLKKHAEELESYHGELLESEEALNTKNRVFKVTGCFLLQLLLLVLFFWLFILQLSPQAEVVVVPT